MGRLVDALLAEMAQPELIEAPEPGALRPEPNPCRRLYGPGPRGQTCRGCIHLRAHGSFSRTYHKCDLRTCTKGGATDHRTGWTACGRYEPKRRPAPGNL